jgi:hypothetical protein
VLEIFFCHFKRLIFASFLICATGCRPGIHVEVDAISSQQDSALKCYVIVPEEPLTQESEHYEQFCGYLEHVLDQEGFVKAATPDAANIEIHFSYGIDGPKYLVLTNYPNGPDKRSAQKEELALEAFKHQQEVQVNPGLLCNPFEGLLNTQNEIEVRATYTCFYQLKAKDLVAQKRAKRPRQLWSLKATTRIDQNALDRAFPMLLSASRRFIGSSSVNTVSVFVNEEDWSVIRIKNGL